MILELLLSILPIIIIIVVFKFFIDLTQSKKRNVPKFINRNKERVRKEGKEPLKKLHLDDDDDDDEFGFEDDDFIPMDIDDDDDDDFGFEDDDELIEP